MTNDIIKIHARPKLNAPNLLAAYSSNLFGIVCVAFVKIRHVRGYKRRLILAAQGVAVPVSPSAPIAS